MPSPLTERLKALGVKVGTQGLKPASTPSVSLPLEEVLSGELLQTPYGETFAVEQRFQIGSPHGASKLGIDAPLDGLATWMGDGSVGDCSREEIAFLDTETTGLSGGTGTYAFLIGAARFSGDELILRQFFLRDPSDEPAQLTAFEDFLAPCQAIATFNGKAFDVPLLLTRFTVNGLSSPLKDLKHIDLLHLARHLWRERLPSRTLTNLEVQVLGALRSDQDIPGWMIPEIYFNFLRGENPETLRSVFYHNTMDVLSMTALLNHMAWLLADPIGRGSRFGIDLIALAKLFEGMGDQERAAQLYLLGLEHEDANSEMFPRAALLQALGRLAAICKRQNDLNTAIRLWQQAADHHHLEAMVELAKCCEHRLKDLPEAVHWTEKALELVNGSALTDHFQKKQMAADLIHRLERLKRKMANEP